MAGGHMQGPRRPLVVVGAAVLLGFGASILAPCANSATPAAPRVLSARTSSKPTRMLDPVAARPLLTRPPQSRSAQSKQRRRSISQIRHAGSLL